MLVCSSSIIWDSAFIFETWIIFLFKKIRKSIWVGLELFKPTYLPVIYNSFQILSFTYSKRRYIFTKFHSSKLTKGTYHINFYSLESIEIPIRFCGINGLFYFNLEVWFFHSFSFQLSQQCLHVSIEKGRDKCGICIFLKP